MNRFLLLILLASTADAAEYAVKKDDFSNGAEHTITFIDKGNKASLFVSCADETKSFWVQIYIDEVIFPDDVRESSMILGVTHKFDSADEAISGYWVMPMMKYHNAQFSGDESKFVNEAASANKLAIKQNKSGAKYVFMINAEDRKNLRTVGIACGLVEDSDS